MTDPELRSATRSQTVRSATVIAASEPGAAIAGQLRAHGLKATIFERAELLPNRAANDRAHGAENPTVAVAWTQDPSTLSQAIAALAQRYEDVPLIVVCEEIQRWGIRSALNGGAAGVVLYEDLASTFGPCLQAVLAGQICVPQEYARQVEPPALSSREKQILGLVVMGYMNGQIAERLFLAESTVKSHLSSAFGKLGVRSRNEAVSLILDPDRGLGMGILALVGNPAEPTSTAPS